MIGNLMLVIYGLVYLHHLVVTISVDNLNKYSLFWISTGILLCHGFATCIFLVDDYNVKNMALEKAMVIWSLFTMSNIARNIFFAVGINYSRLETQVPPADNRQQSELVNGSSVSGG